MAKLRSLTLAERRSIIKRLSAALYGRPQRLVRIEDEWSRDGAGDMRLGMRVVVDGYEAFREGDAGTYCTEARGLYLLHRAVIRRCIAVDIARDKIKAGTAATHD